MTEIKHEKRGQKPAETVERMVRDHLRAMGCERFDLGILPDAGDMILREWQRTIEIEKVIKWLRRENARGAHIYIRPAGTHSLSLIDDLSVETIDRMKAEGFELSDCRAIIGKAAKARRVVLVGASFIAMEVAASFIHRNLQVHVVAPEAVPMERVLGPQVGEHLRRLHERNGVVFHLQQSVVAIDERRVMLKDGNAIEADLVVIGIGVRPLTDLAERAGIKTDKGVLVNEYLETSIPQIYAAGDIARWPDPLTGDHIRVEHWVVAERQGQTAARNMLGCRERFETVPFFWTTQYDFTLNYIGHAETWDKLVLDGSIEEHDCKLSFRGGGKTLAVATIGRDRESLESELAMERAVQAG